MTIRIGEIGEFLIAMLRTMLSGFFFFFLSHYQRHLLRTSEVETGIENDRKGDERL